MINHTPPYHNPAP